MELNVSLPARKHRLLVVDDDEAVSRKVMERILEPSGYAVSSAENGEGSMGWTGDGP